MRRHVAAASVLLAAGFGLHAAPGLVADYPSGFRDGPFDLRLTAESAGTTIFFTTNGAAPTAAAGVVYDRPLRISTTTVLRASVSVGSTTSPPVTLCRTFLFADDVIHQQGPGLPRAWGRENGTSLPACYHLNAQSLATNVATVREALQALPSLSVIMDPADLFGSQDGIYLHPRERGREWERAAAVEYFDPKATGGFQFTCGVRLHGGTSRQPAETPKHSFRLLFRRRYGPPELRYPLFGTNSIQPCSDLILRAGNNDSWLASEGQTRSRASYLRDEWTRRSLLAMGYPSARGVFVHLYLNGLYWGIYNLCERPGPGLFADTDDQAQDLDYDVRKGARIEFGTDDAWQQVIDLANAGLTSQEALREMAKRVDITQLADFLILNFYAGNSDWDRSANWYAYRPRTISGRFRFAIWDAECVLGSPQATTLEADDDQSPQRLFHRLAENAGFRALFAQRAEKLLFRDGPLTPEAASARYQALVKTVASAMPAEAARWGHYRKELHSFKTGPFCVYTAETNWQSEAARLLHEFFPQRREVLLDQFRDAGLFPDSYEVPGK